MWDEIGAFHRQGQDEKWWWTKARSEIVCECLKRVVPCKIEILEIGAGYGAMTDMLQKFGTVTAVEPYADAVSYLKDTFNMEAFQDTLETYTGTEEYDLVSCFDVLEHVEDEQRALDKIESLIKDNGLLILTVPAYMSLWSKQDEIDHHFRRYSRKELINVISQYFTIKRATYFNTLLFPVAVIDKLLFARKKRSYSLEPNRFVNSILYAIFSVERFIAPLINLPFGVSILVIAEKKQFK
jgi:2-polyprenyl-3-methyl-5-hydroxy-6-metoxy-1,4-benzoquinol methylase